MTPDLRCFHIARFVLEAKSAFSIMTGFSDGAFDSQIVRDANNLPAIPGTSLAGVLRNRFSALPSSEGKRVKKVFGFIEKNKKNIGSPSRLSISWGCVHDSKNNPVEARRNNISEDRLLERLSHDQLLHRERVSINHKGVAENKKKFDVTIVPKGCRFSFEIVYWDEEKNSEEWTDLLSILKTPIFLGASVRSGLGRFELIRLYENCFKLDDIEDYRQFSQSLKSSIGDINALNREKNTNIDKALTYHLTLKLQPEDFWRFGQLGKPLKESEKNIGATQLSEIFIEWKDDKASMASSKHIVVPASGIKGAISHRTLFHFNRITEQFIEMTPDQLLNDYSDGVDQLFGCANGSDDGENSGHAGLIYINDIYLSYKDNEICYQTHTSIDRFTGGVRDTALFSEELIWEKEITLEINFDGSKLKLIDGQVKQAFKMAIDDLNEGRLSLGAGSSKGHGYFSGVSQWSAEGLKLMEVNREK